MKLFVEKTSKILAWVGILLFIAGVVLFIWRDFYFDLDEKINAEKFGLLGNFIGGVIGSLWAFAGVILFYVALTEQRKDFTTNRDVLNTQISALEQQIKAFEEQQAELQKTREILIDQSKTLKKQQFESTFFNSISLLNNITANISFTTGRKDLPAQLVKQLMASEGGRKTEHGKRSFKLLYFRFQEYYLPTKDKYLEELPEEVPFESGRHILPLDAYSSIISESYNSFFIENQSELGHYFRTTYNIIKFIDDSNVDNPKYYTNLVRAQFSTYEHLLLFYNCLSKYGKERFYPLIVRYSLLNNMPIAELMDEEHETLYPKGAY